MNGVPRSLQSQISPERAQEITDPSRQPLPAPQIPRMTNKAFPPLPQQTSPAPAGSGGGISSLTQNQGQQMRPGEADKLWEKAPKKNLWENPLNYKGIEVIPSVNPDGGKLELRVPWDQIFKNK